MSGQAPITQNTDEAVMARWLVDALNLQHIVATEIVPTAPLFGHDSGSLGLDSIDALEIALAIQQHYGVELQSEDPETRPAFSSLRSLTDYVLRKRGQR
jgi:acyl carrier protein